MSTRSRYSTNRVEREDRPDGTILLRSPHPLPEPVRTSADWLRRWAGERPDAVFLAERSGPGWRELRYGTALQQVRAVAAALLDRGLSSDTPILILSGNGIDHGILSLAAHWLGIPTVPVAEQYSLIPGAQKQLAHIVELIGPRLVYAEDGARFLQGLAIDTSHALTPWSVETRVRVMRCLRPCCAAACPMWMRRRCRSDQTRWSRS
jgi:feruloyl-CoA synthase